MGSSTSCPPSISYTAVVNLGLKPVKGDGPEAASANDQIIQNEVTPKTSKLFADNFFYDPPKKLPIDIYSSDGYGKLKGSNTETYWYVNNDPDSDKSLKLLVEAQVNAIGDADLFPLDSKNDMVDAIITEIKGLFKFNYSVWVPDTDTYYGPVNKDETGKKYRARIDLAYYAYHGKDVYQNDGVYLDIKTASYVAKYSI